MNNAGPGGGGILANLFGGGGMGGFGGGGLLDSMLSPEQQQMMNQRRMGQFAQGLLAASGPSRMPVSFGQAMGQGMQSMQGADDQLIKEMTAVAALKKANETDIGALGEKAFMKAKMGQPLTAQEQAALEWADSKTQNYGFNPVTGALEAKPSLLDRAGLGGKGAAPQAPGMSAPTAAPGTAPMQPSPFGDAGAQPANEWEAEKQRQLAAAAGNPKLQQSIMENFAKSMISMSDAESKNAGFSDRMMQSNPIIDQTKDAGMSQLQRGLGAVPVVGNYMVSDDFQSFDQAKRDFINAQLRRESGAVISPSEFDNADKQYFPRPGDNEQVLRQKAANREAAMKGMQRSAGPAYKPTGQPKSNSNVSKPSQSAVQFLMQNPQFAPQFEQKYGISAKTYLGM